MKVIIEGDERSIRSIRQANKGRIRRGIITVSEYVEPKKVEKKNK